MDERLIKNICDCETYLQHINKVIKNLNRYGKQLKSKKKELESELSDAIKRGEADREFVLSSYVPFYFKKHGVFFGLFDALELMDKGVLYTIVVNRKLYVSKSSILSYITHNRMKLRMRAGF